MQQTLAYLEMAHEKINMPRPGRFLISKKNLLKRIGILRMLLREKRSRTESFLKMIDHNKVIHSLKIYRIHTQSDVVYKKGHLTTFLEIDSKTVTQAMRTCCRGRPRKSRTEHTITIFAVKEPAGKKKRAHCSPQNWETKN
ncbi:unnamed protein product [Amoebophrya sp. A25]|nr:unnamed protein product [Amoebophrya sp. A25]|eukprot:GSA25T00005416001.1